MVAKQRRAQQARARSERKHGAPRPDKGHFPESVELVLASRDAAVVVCRWQGPASCFQSRGVWRRSLRHVLVAEKVVLCQDWAKPLWAFGLWRSLLGCLAPSGCKWPVCSERR